MFHWLAHQINTHPRASAGLVVARLCMWLSTAIWGMHAVVQSNAFIHPIYRALNLQSVEDLVGTVALVMGLVQIWRIFTHENTYWFGCTCNAVALLWYSYFMYAMFVFVPMAGPVFSAFTTLMCVISIVSTANDFWLNEKIKSWLSTQAFIKHI